MVVEVGLVVCILWFVNLVCYSVGSECVVFIEMVMVMFGVVVVW